MNKVLQLILTRLGERSTWQGLVALLSALGVALDPGRLQAIAAAAVAVIGLIHVFFPQCGVIGQVAADAEAAQAAVTSGGGNAGGTPK